MVSENSLSKILNHLNNFLLHKHSDVFSDGTTALSRIEAVFHHIETGNAPLVKLPSSRLPHLKQEIVREKLEKMVKD